MQGVGVMNAGAHHILKETISNITYGTLRENIEILHCSNKLIVDYASCSRNF